MKRNKLLKILILISVLGISFWVRYKNYDQVPLPGGSVDEYSYSWVGLSLIRQGYPVGISGIPGYTNKLPRYINPDMVMNMSVTGPRELNYPWFDHPPGLGLMTGGYGFIKGVTNFEDLSVRIIRRPMIILGTLSVFLVFWLAFVNFGFGVALVSGLIYGLQPLAVIGGRMVQGENGMIPFLLLSVIFVSLYIRKGKFFQLVLAAVFAGMAMLFKISGVAGIISAILLIILSKKQSKPEDILVFLGISGSIASLFLIYGYFFDIKTFFDVLFSNASRFYGIGPEAIYRLVTQTRFVADKSIPDGWIFVGWVSVLAALITKGKDRKWLVIPVLSYLTVYLFFGSLAYVWYTLPFVPFLAIASGYFIYNLVVKNKLTGGFLWTIIPGGVAISALMTVEKFQKYATFWRFYLPLTILMLVLIEFLEIKKFSKLGKLLIWLNLAMALGLGFWLVTGLDNSAWYKLNY